MNVEDRIKAKIANDREKKEPQKPPPTREGSLDRNEAKIGNNFRTRQPATPSEKAREYVRDAFESGKGRDFRDYVKYTIEQRDELQIERHIYDAAMQFVHACSSTHLTFLRDRFIELSGELLKPKNANEVILFMSQHLLNYDYRFYLAVNRCVNEIFFARMQPKLLESFRNLDAVYHEFGPLERKLLMEHVVRLAFLDYTEKEDH